MSRLDIIIGDLERLSDWSNSESDEESNSNRRDFKTRIELQFRLDKPCVHSLLVKIYPHFFLLKCQSHIKQIKNIPTYSSNIKKIRYS